VATYLVDTNILVDAINGKRNRNELLTQLAEAGHTLACCPINVAEIYAGMRPKEEQRTGTLLRSLQLFPISFEVAELAGTLKLTHSRKGVTLSLADAIIAAVAIHNRVTLITANVKDFPMKEIAIFQE
jgi:predicted nucleic acid-binding protein